MLDRLHVSPGTVTNGAASAGPATERRERRAWIIAIGGAAALLYALKGQNVLSDPDSYWHVATGQRIAASLSLPVADPFSHTAFGQEWILFEWLSQIVFSAAYALGGWNGVAILSFASATAAICVLARHLLRSLSSTHVLVICLLAATLSLPSVLARPHVLAWPIMVLWTATLVRAVDTGERPPLWLLPLATVWANMHGSFMLGLGLMGVLALEAALAGWRARDGFAAARSWAAFCVLAGLATLLTPQGLGNVLHILSVQLQPVQMAAIDAWQPVNFQKFQPLGVWLAVFIAVAFSVGLKLPPLRIAALLLLVFLALRHARHVELVGFLAPLFLARGLAEALAARGALGSASPFPARAVAGVGVACLLAVLGTAAFTRFQPAREITPSAALAAFGPAGPPGKVLNDYDFGGYLIAKGVPTFIDGRSDLFGDPFLAGYIKGVMVPEKPETLAAYLEEHEIAWTLLPPARRAVKLLDELPGWQRLYGDDVAVVHVRTSPAATGSLGEGTGPALGLRGGD